jgi:hypothetical protein
MSSLGSSSGPAKRASYAPFMGGKPKAVDNGSSYLSALKNAAPVSSSFSSPAPSSSAGAPSGTNAPGQTFMESLGSNSAPAKRASYAPFMGGKPKAVESGSSYLSALKNAAPLSSTAAATPSYQAPAAASAPSYSSAPPASSSNQKSFSPFGAKPKAVKQSGYLSGL